MAFSDGDIVNSLLDEIGWPATMRKIDTTAGTEYPKWWTDQSVLQIIYDLELIALGFFFINHLGYAVWEGRNTRVQEHPTSEATFDDSDDAIELGYDLDDQNIFNKIIAKAEYEETETIATEQTATDTISVTIKTDYFKYYTVALCPQDTVLSWGTPKVYGKVDGEWQLVSPQDPEVVSTSAHKMEVKFFPYGSSIWYKITCDYTYSYWEYTDETTTVETEHTAEDADSIAKYGLRTKLLDLPFKLNAQGLAESLVNSYLSYYKEPHAKVQLTIIGKTDELLTQILTRHVSDRITVISSALGLSADFYINKATHLIPQDSIHRVTWELIKIADVTGVESQGVWILGVSKLGVGTILGQG